MALSWPKYLMLWLAIAAYCVQAAFGGSGLVICLGGNEHQLHESNNAVAIEPTCDHHECGAAAQLVNQHDEHDEECPCTDILIDDNEPGRVEDQLKLAIAKVKHEIADAPVTPWTTWISVRVIGPRTAIERQCAGRGSGPEVMRTIVFLI